MFGENILSGIKNIKIDKEGNFKLPKETFSEPNERLYYLTLKNEIRIYSESELERISKILFDYIKENNDYKTFSRMRRLFFGLLLYEETVKNNNKIVIPKKIREKYKLNKNIILVGSENHIKIFNNENSLNNYKLQKKHN